MGKALKTAGAIIGGAVLVATGVGALAGLNVAAMGIASFTGSLTIGQLGMISAGMSAVGGMLDRPKSSGAAPATDWTANEDQPTPFAFGRVGVAGKIVHWDEYGKDNKLKSFVSVYSGAGPIKGFISFKAGDLPVSFESNGGTAIGKYRRQMWRSWKVGNQPDTALALPTGLDEGAVMPQWGGAYKLSGKACDLWTLQQDSKLSVYPGNAEPKPLTVLDGVFGYDPRQDSTYPGGFGDCRIDDRSTWPWIKCPIIAGLNWALGMRENGQVVGGIGASPSGIDFGAFVECANIAEANGWEVSAWPDTSQDASVVLDQFLQAGGAVRARHAGKISCVSRGAARPSIVTITRSDTAGAIELDTGASAFNRLNTITPRIMSEARGWKLWPADPVTFAAFRAEDGGKRGDKVDYPFVPKVQQGAQLAAYDILDAREPFAGTIPLKPHLRRLKRGDCFDIDEPGFLLDGVKCIVLGRSYDPSKGEVRIAFRSETDSKHDLALGKTTTMPEYPVLTPSDPTHVTPPLPGDWTITPRPPAPGGGQLPGFDLGGIVSNETATAVIVEYGPEATGPWTQAYQGPPTVTKIPIDGLQPGATYYIAVQYQRNQNYSERYVYGPYEAPDLIAGGLAPESPIWGQLNDLTKQALRTAIEAVQALLDEEQRRQIEVNDILERLGLGFLLDPVTRTALIKSETVVQGVGPGGLPETLVQMSARLVAADAANELNTAQALITAEAKINALRSESYAAFATYNAMGDAIAANALVIRGEVTAEIVTATANLVSAAQMGTAITNSELSLRNWTDGRIAGAVAGLAGIAYVDNSLAAAKGQWEAFATAEAARATIGLDSIAAREAALATAKGRWEAYADAASAASVVGLASLAHVAGSLATAKGQWEAYADDASARSVVGLDSVAAREAAVGAAVLSLQTWSDGRFATSSALLGVQSTANGASSTAALALSAANGSEAYAALLTDVDGRITGARINGTTGIVEILSSIFRLTSTGSGARTEHRDSTWYVYDPDASTRTMYGKPFGGSDKLVWWTGPSSVTEGSEAKANAYVFISMTAPRIGGTDFPSSGGGGGAAYDRSAWSEVTVTTTWTTLGEVTFTGKPSAGWWDLVAQGVFGTTSGSRPVEFRVIENGATDALATASATITSSPDLLELFLSPPGPWAQTRPAGSLSLRLQARVTSSGTVSLSGEIGVDYKPRA